jgi:hypothetical protein
MCVVVSLAMNASSRRAIVSRRRGNFKFRGQYVTSELSPYAHTSQACPQDIFYTFTVRRIAGCHNLGLTPEKIAARIERLTLAQVHAALTCSHANRDEIDGDIAAEQAAVEEIFPASVVP